MESPPSPVNMALDKTRKRRKSQRKGGKKTKKNTGKESPKSPEEPVEAIEEPPQESQADVLDSFKDVYQGVIKSLPVCFWPTSSKHGQHSYTV